jgi:hypothetical protein
VALVLEDSPPKSNPAFHFHQGNHRMDYYVLVVSFLKVPHTGDIQEN